METTLRKSKRTKMWRDTETPKQSRRQIRLGGNQIIKNSRGHAPPLREPIEKQPFFIRENSGTTNEDPMDEYDLVL